MFDSHYCSKKIVRAQDMIAGGDRLSLREASCGRDGDKKGWTFCHIGVKNKNNTV